MARKRTYPRGISERDGSIRIAFSFNNEPHYKTLGLVGSVTVEDAVRARLKIREQIMAGTYQHSPKPKPILPAAPVVTVGDLWQPYIVNYRNTKGRDEQRLAIAWSHLKSFQTSDDGMTLETLAVESMSTPLINRYIEARRDVLMKANPQPDREKAKLSANGTLNREICCLRAMYRYGSILTPPLVGKVPYFGKRLKESAPRKGFIEQPQYDALQKHAGDTWLKAFLCVDYAFGFRSDELLSMRVEQIDLLNREIRLFRDTTKTDEPRIVSFDGNDAMYELLGKCVSGKADDAHVFTREDGSPVVDMRDDWYAVAVAAKLGRFVPAKTKKGKEYPRYVGVNVHDFRRSAVRNMVRAGIPEKIAMEISGHKTRAVFDRYNIVDTRDIARASKKITQYQYEQQRQPAAGEVVPAVEANAVVQ